jgi:hypothetical protein
MNVSKFRRIRQCYGVQGSRLIEVLTALERHANQEAIDDGEKKMVLKCIPEELKNFTSDGDETAL